MATGPGIKPTETGDMTFVLEGPQTNYPAYRKRDENVVFLNPAAWTVVYLTDSLLGSSALDDLLTLGNVICNSPTA